MLALATAACIIGTIVSVTVVRKNVWTGSFSVLGGAGLVWFDHITFGALLTITGSMFLFAAMLHASMPSRMGEWP